MAYQMSSTKELETGKPEGGVGWSKADECSCRVWAWIPSDRRKRRVFRTGMWWPQLTNHSSSFSAGLRDRRHMRQTYTCCRSLQDLVSDPWCLQELHPDLLSPGSWPPNLGALQVLSTSPAQVPRALTFLTHIHTHQPRRERVPPSRR